MESILHVAMGTALVGFIFADHRDMRTQCLGLFVLALVGAIVMQVLA